MKKVRIISEHFELDSSAAEGALRSRGLFKTLSLLLADNVGVEVPETRLLLTESVEAVHQVGATWGFPVMLRMDYSHLPRAKPIGGIPVHSERALTKLSRFLFAHELLPLFHPHASRFDDQYSAGVVLSRKSLEAKIEIVGKGFDAGDLRLGWGIPHQRIEIDFTELKSVSRWTISQEQFATERLARYRRIQQLTAYTTMANKEGCLSSKLPVLKHFDLSVHHEQERIIPARYSPMSQGVTKALASSVFAIWSQVLPKLPESNEYVASLSWLPGKGWSLWDVYGHWYLR